MGALGKIVYVRPDFSSPNPSWIGPVMSEIAGGDGLTPLPDRTYHLRKMDQAHYAITYAHRDAEFGLGDIIVTGKYSVCCLEFLIGGRVELRCGAVGVVNGERSVYWKNISWRHRVRAVGQLGLMGVEMTLSSLAIIQNTLALSVFDVQAYFEGLPLPSHDPRFMPHFGGEGSDRNFPLGTSSAIKG